MMKMNFSIQLISNKITKLYKMFLVYFYFMDTILVIFEVLAHCLQFLALFPHTLKGAGIPFLNQFTHAL